MKIADLNTGAAKIHSAYKALRAQWDNTKDHWHDQNRRKFEENYLDPLEPQIAAALEAISQLNELLGQAERACE